MLKLRIQNELLEAGCDEAGRGCLAGPVTAAAVILPNDFSNPLLTDSKQLTEKQRDSLRPIIEQEAIAWHVVHISPEEIDKINILNASILGMQQAALALSPLPEFLAIDGNKFKPLQTIKHQCVIKGDATYMNIAAASVLAKTHRDEIMLALHQEYPYFNWQKNKGYPTKEHRIAIEKHGITPHHRLSFGNNANQLRLSI